VIGPVESATSTGEPQKKVDLPYTRGGWWHNYVCPVHGTELLPQGIPGARPPAGGLPCEYGCGVDTEDVRGAWLVLSHQAWARRADVQAYRAARTDDPVARDEAVALLTGLADVYARVAMGGENEQAQGWMLRGRLFQQALTDAIWSVSIGHAAWSLAGTRPGGAPELHPLLPVLDQAVEAARAGRQHLVDDGHFTSNYTAWLNASGRVCGVAASLIRGETPSTGVDDDWVGGEYGQIAHMLASTTRGGWEWEATTYYHGFVLRAYLLSLRGCEPTLLPENARDRLLAMIGVLEDLATDGGILPAVHDGPYRRAGLALEWMELCALSDAFARNRRLGAVADRAGRDAGTQADDLADEIRTIPGGWFGAPALEVPARPRARVAVDEESGICVLRADGIHAVLDYGPHGGSHGHHDKLSLALYGAVTPWQPDPGQVPYGHRAWRAYYASAAAHPTVRVDDRDPAEATGTLITRTADSVTVSVTGDENTWYEGARAIRHVAVASGYLLDVVRAAADRPRRLTLGLRPDVDLTVRQSGDLVRTQWNGEETLWGLHRGFRDSAAPGNGVLAIAHPGPGPADDPQRVRTHVDWTADGATTVTWVSVFEAGAATVVDVQVDGATVVVRHGDGRVDRHQLPEQVLHD